MPVMLKSSEVQQNFGRVMDQALTETEVIVERYGVPRVAILSYQRYQQLLKVEQATAIYLHLPDQSLAAQEQGKRAAELVRQELGDDLVDGLDEVMGELRGRQWSS